MFLFEKNFIQYKDILKIDIRENIHGIFIYKSDGSREIIEKDIILNYRNVINEIKKNSNSTIEIIE